MSALTSGGGKPSANHVKGLRFKPLKGGWETTKRRVILLAGLIANLNANYGLDVLFGDYGLWFGFEFVTGMCCYFLGT